VIKEKVNRTGLQFDGHMRIMVFWNLFQLSQDSSLNLFQSLEKLEYIHSSYFCLIILPDLEECLCSSIRRRYL